MYRLDQILRELDRCEPYKPSTITTRRERFINRLSGWLLLFSGAFFLLLLGLALWCGFHPPGQKILWLAQAVYILCTLSAIIALFLPALYGLFQMLRWKKEAMVELIYEIDHDETAAARLSPYSRQELEYAQFWLRQKITRLLVRVGSVFGDKTALIAIVGLAYSVIKGLGGPDKLFAMFNKGIASAEGIVIQGLALLLGISLGALMLKKMASYYTGKLEIVELALKIQELKTEEAAEDSGCR